MSFLGKIFGGKKRNKRLALWAKKVSVSDSQQTAMEELWYAGVKNHPPDINPLEKLSQDEVDYILKICSANFRPKEFGSANTLRLSSFRYLIDLGFSKEQSAVIVGMIFNMVGRPDL